MNKYLRDRISDTYSSWEEILYGVPQGLILGLLLFHKDLYDLLVKTDQPEIANYADDNKYTLCIWKKH